MEVASCLVTLTVFKTDGGRTPSLVSSILIYLRQNFKPTPFMGSAFLISTPLGMGI